MLASLFVPGETQGDGDRVTWGDGTDERTGDRDQPRSRGGANDGRERGAEVHLVMAEATNCMVRGSSASGERTYRCRWVLMMQKPRNSVL